MKSENTKRFFDPRTALGEFLGWVMALCPDADRARTSHRLRPVILGSHVSYTLGYSDFTLAMSKPKEKHDEMQNHLFS